MIKGFSIPAVSIPYDALMLGAAVQELSKRLCGGQIQDIRHPGPNELHLGIYTRSGTLHLLISIDARFARVHLTSRKAANSPVPTEFCSALRRRIEGGRVDSVIQVGVDRIMELNVVSNDGEGSKTNNTLIVELMGKHSNIILVDGAGRIVESARRISHRINRVRETLPGLTYVRPPGVYDAPLPSLVQIVDSVVQAANHVGTAESLGTVVRKCVPFASPFLAAEIARRCTIQNRDAEPYWLKFGKAAFAGQHESSGDLRDRIHASLEMIFTKREYLPVITKGCRGAGVYPIPMMQISADLQATTFSLNEALNTGYDDLLRRVQKQETADRLVADIGRETARQTRITSSLNRTIDEASRADILTQSGDLVLANLWLIKPGDTEVSVTDYYDENGSSRTIRLNPELSSQENAGALFDKARRARQGLDTARTRLDKSAVAISALNEARSKLDVLVNDPTIETEMGTVLIQELALSLIDRGLLRAAPDAEERPVSQFQGHRIRREVTPEGFEILVGDSATANDFLTTRVARPDDLWLHVRSASGGHVVIRTHGKPERVPEVVLERAAIIGALHSAQKHSSLVAVDYTLKKYVRKPRGAKPGAVVIEREKTIHVSPVSSPDK